MREPHIHISRANIVSASTINTKSGKQMLKYRIAVNPGRYDQNHQWQDGTSQFYDVIIFNHIDHYQTLSKGSHIAVDGRLELEEYTSKDGQKRQSWRIIGADITIVPDAPKQQNNTDIYGGGYDNADPAF